MVIKYEINDSKKSINDILLADLKISNRLLYKLIKSNKIFLNNELIDTRKSAQLGDIISIDLNYDEECPNIVPTKMHIDIIYEDDAILAINKSAGIATHPSRMHYDNTLSNGVKFYFTSISLNKKIRPVNRLDLNTSGIVIFAKNEYVQENLIKQMSSSEFKKEYLAICDGIFKIKKGTINKPIARKEASIIERCISEEGKSAITHYEVLKEFDNYSLVKCLLETGRTHQIRVHMASMGHPILGDSLYGNTAFFASGQALHCYKTTFLDPVTYKSVNIECLPTSWNTKFLHQIDTDLKR